MNTFWSKNMSNVLLGYGWQSLKLKSKTEVNTWIENHKRIANLLIWGPRFLYDVFEVFARYMYAQPLMLVFIDPYLVRKMLKIMPQICEAIEVGKLVWRIILKNIYCLYDVDRLRLPNKKGMNVRMDYHWIWYIKQQF